MANEKKVLIRVENLKQYFPVRKASFKQKEVLYVRANDDITLDLVGESGCGKSTLGRTLLQLYNQTDGRTMYYGEDIDELPDIEHSGVNRVQKSELLDYLEGLKEE